MSSGTILILLLIGLPLVMMFMHGGRAGGMAGGCCGGHGHGHADRQQNEPSSDDRQKDEQLLPVGGSAPQSKPTEPSVPARS